MLGNHRLPLRIFLFTLIVFVTWITLSVRGAVEFGEKQALWADATLADGLEAWEQVYSVLTHPRCINCHTATNYPQQETTGAVMSPM